MMNASQRDFLGLLPPELLTKIIFETLHDDKKSAQNLVVLNGKKSYVDLDGYNKMLGLNKYNRKVCNLSHVRNTIMNRLGKTNAKRIVHICKIGKLGLLNALYKTPTWRFSNYSTMTFLYKAIEHGNIGQNLFNHLLRQCQKTSPDFRMYYIQVWMLQFIILGNKKAYNVLRDFGFIVTKSILVHIQMWYPLKNWNFVYPFLVNFWKIFDRPCYQENSDITNEMFIYTDRLEFINDYNVPNSCQYDLVTVSNYIRNIDAAMRFLRRLGPPPTMENIKFAILHNSQTSFNTLLTLLEELGPLSQEQIDTIGEFLLENDRQFFLAKFSAKYHYVYLTIPNLRKALLRKCWSILPTFALVGLQYIPCPEDEEINLLLSTMNLYILHSTAIITLWKIGVFSCDTQTKERVFERSVDDTALIQVLLKNEPSYWVWVSQCADRIESCRKFL